MKASMSRPDAGTRCKHCDEPFAPGNRFYICTPIDEIGVRWFFHKECLETEAEKVSEPGDGDVQGRTR